MDSRKDKIARLQNDLHKSIAPEALAVKQLVDLLFEEAKHKLVSSDGGDTLRLQGEARFLGDLSKKLREGIPTLREQ